MFQRLIPGDPAVAMLGEHATEENVATHPRAVRPEPPGFPGSRSPGQVAIWHGFFDTQYFRYLGRLLRLDLGNFHPPPHPGG